MTIVKQSIVILLTVYGFNNISMFYISQNVIASAMQHKDVNKGVAVCFYNLKA